MRLVAVVAAASVVIAGLAVTGCSFRESGSNVRSDTASGEEIVADASVSRPMILWSSAIRAIGWVVVLPFTPPGGSEGDTAKIWVDDPLKYAFCSPIGEMKESVDQTCMSDEG